MFQIWRLDAEATRRKVEARNKIWSSPFAHQLYDEIMKDSPSYIGFESGRICWGNILNRRPQKELRFSEWGYYSLKDLEQHALMDLFVYKSKNTYYKYSNDDNCFWPYRMVRIVEHNTPVLRNW